MKHHGLIHQMQSDQYKPVFLYHQLSLPMYCSLWQWTKETIAQIVKVAAVTGNDSDLFRTTLTQKIIFLHLIHNIAFSAVPYTIYYTSILHGNWLQKISNDNSNNNWYRAPFSIFNFYDNHVFSFIFILNNNKH